MSKAKEIIVSHHEPDYGSTAKYITGFILSLLLTLTAYNLTIHHKFTGNSLLYVLAVLAFTQFLVQMFYFLHLGGESKPRWKLLVFSFMVLVVGIIVTGSIWIMNNLNYHHIDPHKASDTYIIHDEGVQ